MKEKMMKSVCVCVVCVCVCDLFSVGRAFCGELVGHLEADQWRKDVLVGGGEILCGATLGF